MTHRSKTRTAATLAALVAAGFLTAGCERDSDLENAAEEFGDAVEDAAEDVGDAGRDLRDSVEDGAEKMKDAVGDG